MSTEQVNDPDQSKNDASQVQQQQQLVVAINGGSKLSLSAHSDPKSLASALTHPRPSHRHRLPWDALRSARQTLVAVRHRLTDRASSWMTKVRRFRGLGGGGGGGGSGSLPRRVRRVLVSTADRARRRFGSGPGPVLRESWTRETTRLKQDARRIGFWRAVVGEFLGSLFLVLIGCGAGVETDRPQKGSVTVRVALAFGVTYAAGLYCLHAPCGDSDSCHLNTAVSVAMAVTGRSRVLRSALGVVTQMLGAVVGALVLYWVTSADYGTEFACTRLSPKSSEAQGFLVEFFATLVLVFVVFACYDDRSEERKAKSSLAPFVVGLTLLSVSLFAVSFFISSRLESLCIFAKALAFCYALAALC